MPINGVKLAGAYETKDSPMAGWIRRVKYLWWGPHAKLYGVQNGFLQRGAGYSCHIVSKVLSVYLGADVVRGPRS